MARRRASGNGMPDEILPEGKLRHELLESLISLTSRDPSIRVGAAVGEDAAVVHGHRSLVLTADPVTFATEEIGFYAVAVNCNDVAAMGAEPRYLTTTVLLPPGTTESAVRSLFRDVAAAAERAGLLWTGGHAEVTSAVARTVVSAHVVGFLDREPTESSHARPGHDLVMTKWVGLEGSTLIVREHPRAAARILGAERSRSVLAWLRDPGISILPEARLLRDLPLGAAHDPTEGGLAAACHEIAERSQVGMRLDAEAVPIREETRLLCREWGLDPLGLLGSGALLFTAEPEAAREALRRLAAAGIPGARIGAATDAAGGVRLASGGASSPLARFDRDELLKIEGSPA